MSDQFNLLVVEDDDDQYQLYKDTAEDLDFNINLTREISAEAAQNSLLSNNFDGAIVDLNLSQENPAETSGNQVLREIIESHRFPVLVVSGNLANLDEEIRDKQSDFLYFYARETDNSTIFEHLLRIYQTGITRILGGRGRIEKSLTEVFWRHLASNFNLWNTGSNDSERTLLRYTVAHLAEYLDIPDGVNKFYHEAEFYIKPPIREHIATGDIVKREENTYILLSPPCDVTVRNNDDHGNPIINANRVMLAPLIPINREQFLTHGLINENDNTKICVKNLEGIIKGQREKYVFLPSYLDINATIADFQNPHTWSFDEYLNAERIATVSGVFLKDIQSRFSSYYARQGQPDLDKQKLINQYKVDIIPPPNNN